MATEAVTTHDMLVVITRFLATTCTECCSRGRRCGLPACDALKKIAKKLEKMEAALNGADDDGP